MLSTYGLRAIGSPAYPVSRFSSTPATIRASTCVPGDCRVTTTPKFATRLEIRTR